MRLRKFHILVLSLLGASILGSAAYVARDCAVTRRTVNRFNVETADARKALAEARRQARETVRDRLRRSEEDAGKTDAGKVEKVRRAAKDRQTRVRHFLASRGFAASAAYVDKIAMPDSDPTDADQEIIDLSGEAASEADLETAADVLEAALASKDPRARISAVEMLSGLGEAGLVDMSVFLTDPHPDVANLAADRWGLGIQGLTDEREQAALAKVGFLAMTDEDQLRSLGGTLMLVSDAKLAVDVLTEVIRDGAKVQRTAAQEAYEGVTGEKWVNEKTALAWLEKNCEPPEPEEPESGEEGADQDEESAADESGNTGTDDLTGQTQTLEEDYE